MIYKEPKGIDFVRFWEEPPDSPISIRFEKKPDRKAAWTNFHVKDTSPLNMFSVFQ
jgi:hypothetical protein